MPSNRRGDAHHPRRPHVAVHHLQRAAGPAADDLHRVVATARDVKKAGQRGDTYTRHTQDSRDQNTLARQDLHVAECADKTRTGMVTLPMVRQRNPAA